MQPRLLVERARGDDQLVRLVLGDERVKSGADGVGRADERAAEHALDLLTLVRLPVVLDRVDRRRQKRPLTPEDAVDERALRGREQAAGRLFILGDDHVGREHHVRLGELRGRPERLAVDLERGHERGGREVRRERVRQPERGGELRAEETRAEDPQRHVRARAGNGLDVLVGRGIAEQRLQLLDVGRERVGAREVAAQRAHRRLVGAWRAPEPEVDAAGIERVERAELLGDHERRVVGEHHAARAYADRVRALGHEADRHGGRRAGDARHVVVLGQPEAAVARAPRRAGPARASGAARSAPCRPAGSARGRAPRAAASPPEIGEKFIEFDDTFTQLPPIRGPFVVCYDKWLHV